MQRVLADSGFVVAFITSADQRHSDVRPVYFRYPQILLPRLTLVEVVYLVTRDAGIHIAVAFLKSLPRSRFKLINSTDRDMERAADIMHRYSDSKVDFVDASIMAIAERLSIQTILTIDQRDFRLFRPLHCQSFTLLP